MKAPIVQKLRKWDSANDSEGFVEAALQHPKDLHGEELFLLVFHAWRIGRLESVRPVLKSHRHDESLAFFVAHELKSRGEQRQSYETLKTLSRLCKSPIVQFRYLNEALNFESLSDVKREMELGLPQLPVSRQTALLFNFGNAEIQTGNLSGAEQVRRQLKSMTDPVAQYFSTWLDAAILEYSALHLESLRKYELALAQCEKLRSRRIDISVLAFCVVEQAFWCGTLEPAERAFERIQTVSSDGVSHLSQGRTAIASALVKVLRGEVGEALSLFCEEFSKSQMEIHHLQGAFYYLWLLLISGEPALLKEMVVRFSEAKPRLNLSEDFFDFDSFLVFGEYLLKSLDRTSAESRLVQLETKKIYSSTVFPFKWTRVFRHLVSGSPASGLQALAEATEFPVLQRFLVRWFSQHTLSGAQDFWLRVEQTASCEIARQAARIQVSRIAQNLIEFASATRSQEGMIARAWLQWGTGLGSDFTQERARQAELCQLAWDPQTGRIFSLLTGHDLNQQKQLSELLDRLLKQTEPLSKEQMALALGISSYHPLQHDPVIHANLLRVREWLRKNAPKVEVERMGQGWGLTRRDLIFGPLLVLQSAPSKRPEVSARSAGPGAPTSAPAPLTAAPPTAAPPTSAPPTSVPQSFQPRVDLPWVEGLNVRQLWILQYLKGHPYINRQILMEQFEVEKSTVASDFKQLMSQGWIHKGGAARSTFYRLAKDAQV